MRMVNMCSEEPVIHSIRPVGRMFLLGDMAICWARWQVRSGCVPCEGPSGHPCGRRRAGTHSCDELFARGVWCGGDGALWLGLRGRRVSGGAARPRSLLAHRFVAGQVPKPLQLHCSGTV